MIGVGFLEYYLSVWESSFLFPVCGEFNQEWMLGDFPGGAVVKNLPANAGGTGLIPGPEDPISCEATKPVHHNYWTCALEPVSHKYWSPCATTTEACVL